MDSDPLPPNDIDVAIRAEMERVGMPSLAVGIIRDGEVVWERAYGMADREAQHPATVTTVYTLMSVSKTVLATAAMQLWEQGRLDLDADINRYLPFSVRNPRYPDRSVTARMLMTHTSGLAHPDGEVPGWYHFYPDDQTPRMGDWIVQWIVPGGSRYVPQVWKDWPPGTRELYSNIGTWLLAYLVERISGEEYTAYCRAHIFDPLGMDNTGFWLAEVDIADLATPYVEGYRPISHYNSLAYPVGWVRSSVRDYAPFLMAWMDGGSYNGVRILESATVDTMLTLQNPASGICLIWNRWLGEWYGHDGGGTGFSSRAEFHRREGIGIIALSNFQCDALHPGGGIFDLIRVQANRFRDR